MPSVHRSPHTTPMPILLVSTKDNSYCSRTNKIALTIFASLAGFFMFPFVTALAFSSLVTLAAVAYCPENNPLTIRSALTIRPAFPRPREEKEVEIEVVNSQEEADKPMLPEDVAPKLQVDDESPLNPDAIDE